MKYVLEIKEEAVFDIKEAYLYYEDNESVWDNAFWTL